VLYCQNVQIILQYSLADTERLSAISGLLFHEIFCQTMSDLLYCQTVSTVGLLKFSDYAYYWTEKLSDLQSCRARYIFKLAILSDCQGYQSISTFLLPRLSDCQYCQIPRPQYWRCHQTVNTAQVITTAEAVRRPILPRPSNCKGCTVKTATDDSLSKVGCQNVNMVELLLSLIFGTGARLCQNVNVVELLLSLIFGTRARYYVSNLRVKGGCLILRVNSPN
jgi:hypothetical protein